MCECSSNCRQLAAPSSAALLKPEREAPLGGRPGTPPRTPRVDSLPRHRLACRRLLLQLIAQFVEELLVKLELVFYQVILSLERVQELLHGIACAGRRCCRRRKLTWRWRDPCLRRCLRRRGWLRRRRRGRCRRGQYHRRGRRSWLGRSGRTCRGT